MPIIKAISDLRNKANEISDLVHESNEPIFITKNGEGDMVVMSMAQYSKMQLKLDLFSKLAVAQAQRAKGDRGRTLSQVMKDLRKRIREAAWIFHSSSSHSWGRSFWNCKLYSGWQTFRCRCTCKKDRKKSQSSLEKSSTWKNS